MYRQFHAYTSNSKQVPINLLYIIDDMQQNKAFLACIGNSRLVRRTLCITDVNLQV